MLQQPLLGERTTAAEEPLPALQPLLEALQPADALESDASADGLDIDIAGDDKSADVAPAIDWSRYTRGAEIGAGDWAGVEKPSARSGAAVRGRAGLLDRLMNNAGEVSITRPRIDSTVQLLQSSLGELTDTARPYATPHRIAVWQATDLAYALRGPAPGPSTVPD